MGRYSDGDGGYEFQEKKRDRGHQWEGEEWAFDDLLILRILIPNLFSEAQKGQETHCFLFRGGDHLLPALDSPRGTLLYFRGYICFA